MKRKILKYLFLLLISQILFFIIPTLLYNKWLIGVTLLINAFISWFMIKRVEKLYYAKYNNLSSLLYMSCPLIGVITLMSIFYLITKMTSIYLLLQYYFIVYILVYIINIIYLLIRKIFN